MSTRPQKPRQRRRKESPAVRLMRALDRIIIAAEQAEQAKRELLQEREVKQLADGSDPGREVPS